MWRRRAARIIASLVRSPAAKSAVAAALEGHIASTAIARRRERTLARVAHVRESVPVVTRDDMGLTDAVLTSPAMRYSLGLRNYLRPFRGVSKWCLGLCAAIYALLSS